MRNLEPYQPCQLMMRITSSFLTHGKIGHLFSKRESSDFKVVDDGASGVDCGAAVVLDWYWDVKTHDWATDLELLQNQYCDFEV